MIEERRQDISEHLKNPDNENGHHNPRPYLLRQRAPYDFPEAIANNSNYGRNYNRGSEYKAFGVCRMSMEIHLHCVMAEPGRISLLRVLIRLKSFWCRGSDM